MTAARRLKSWGLAALATYAIVMAAAVPVAGWALYLRRSDEKMFYAWVLLALGIVTLGTLAVTAYILCAYGALGFVRRLVLRRFHGDDTADGIVLIGAIAASPMLILILTENVLYIAIPQLAIIGAFLAIWRITGRGKDLSEPRRVF